MPVYYELILKLTQLEYQLIELWNYVRLWMLINCGVVLGVVYSTVTVRECTTI